MTLISHLTIYLTLIVFSHLGERQTSEKNICSSIFIIISAQKQLKSISRTHLILCFYCLFRNIFAIIQGYLSAGQEPLPWIYFSFAAFYFLLNLLWFTLLRSSYVLWPSGHNPFKNWHLPLLHVIGIRLLGLSLYILC